LITGFSFLTLGGVLETYCVAFLNHLRVIRIDTTDMMIAVHVSSHIGFRSFSARWMLPCSETSVRLVWSMPAMRYRHKVIAHELIAIMLPTPSRLGTALLVRAFRLRILLRMSLRMGAGMVRIWCRLVYTLCNLSG